MTARSASARLLTTAEVAERLGVCDKTVRNLVSDGELAYIRIGKRGVRFDPGDVQSYIEGAKCQSTEKAKSGTTTSSSRVGVTTVRRDRTRSGQPKLWSEQNDLKPLLALVRTQGK